MPLHALTEQEKAFLAGYKALCEAHEIEFDIYGCEYEVDLAAYDPWHRPKLVESL